MHWQILPAFFKLLAPTFPQHCIGERKAFKHGEDEYDGRFQAQVAFLSRRVMQAGLSISVLISRALVVLVSSCGTRDGENALLRIFCCRWSGVWRYVLVFEFEMMWRIALHLFDDIKSAWDWCWPGGRVLYAVWIYSFLSTGTRGDKCGVQVQTGCISRRYLSSLPIVLEVPLFHSEQCSSWRVYVLFECMSLALCPTLSNRVLETFYSVCYGLAQLNDE